MLYCSLLEVLLRRLYAKESFWGCPFWVDGRLPCGLAGDAAHPNHQSSQSDSEQRKSYAHDADVAYF